MARSGDNLKVVVGRGPRAVEAGLLDALAAHVRALRADSSLLGSPLLVVVPSGALRRHLVRRVAERCGAALGVVVRTPMELAVEVLASAGVRPPSGAALFDILARRAAGAERVLADELGDLEDAYGLAVGAVGDLLSAGLEDEAVPALERALERALDGSPGIAARRAKAVLHAAGETRRMLREHGLGRPAEVIERATELLVGPTETWPLESGPIHVHGFADAPGRTASLLARLLENDGTLWLDLPDDPARPGRPDAGCAAARRFAERLGAIVPEDAPPAEAPALHAFDAPGEDATCRELAVRLRGLIDRGTVPEDIGIVTPDDTGFAVSLRRHLGRLGVPFSGGALPGDLLPARRRLDAMLAVLSDGGRAGADRWLDAMDRGAAWRGDGDEGGPPSPTADLRLAFRVLGKTRLDTLAALDVTDALDGQTSLRLPVRRGIIVRDGVDGAAPEARAEPRRISARRLEQAAAAARALVAAIDAWPSRASCAQHLDHLDRIATEQLGLDGKDPAAAAWSKACKEIRGLEGPAVDRAELLHLLASRLEDAAGASLGGEGAGVAVHSFARARGLTFQHLFVLGLGREQVPRNVGDHPLLPDATRGALRARLRDLGLASDAHDQQRHVFAQLLSAAGEVTVSWCRTDADGRERSPSSFVERLRIAKQLPRVHAVPRLVSEALALPTLDGGTRPLTAADATVLAGLDGGRGAVRALLPAAIAEGRERFADAAAVDATTLAAARVQVLDEQDPDLREPDGRQRDRAPGPFLGLVGASAGAADPRNRQLWVTSLERVARCPWAAFLEKALQLEVPPDPIANLPIIDPRILGNAAHEALDVLVSRALDGERPHDLETLRGLDAVTIPKPDQGAIHAAVLAGAAAVAREEGMHLAGLHAILAERVLPFVEAAVEADWRAGGVPVLGVEVKGEVAVERPDGTHRGLRFRADRIDRIAGTLRLTDYKTGKHEKTKKQATRAANLAKGVARGQRLQGPAYASVEEGASGRYLFIKPDVEDELRALQLTAADDATTQLFPRTASTLLAAYEAGVLPPRVEDPGGKEPNACERCDLRVACFRGDSGFRRRLARLARRSHAGKAGAETPELLGRLWFLVAEDPT